MFWLEHYACHQNLLIMRIVFYVPFIGTGEAVRDFLAEYEREPSKLGLTHSGVHFHISNNISNKCCMLFRGKTNELTIIFLFFF